MSVLLDKNCRLIVSGMTGKTGWFHTQKMLEYGTNVVAGVTPGRGGTSKEGIPVFDTIAAAKKATNANTSIIFVPPFGAAQAILEANDAGIELCVCITEGIPVLDMMKVNQVLKNSDMVLIGPNCPGIITPGQAKVGIMPNDIHLPGKVGIISRSGTLTYEAVNQLTNLNIGQSTVIGIGGDPIRGLGFIDALKYFKDDEDTIGVVMIGEIGGDGEEKAAEWIQKNFHKPVVSFISGRKSPPGKRMGHAGAIISGSSGAPETKVAALRKANIKVADTIDEVGKLMEQTLIEKGIKEEVFRSK